MVDDASKEGSTSEPDPWAELLGDGNGDMGSPFSFDLDDAAPPVDTPASPEPPAAVHAAPVEPAADDEPVDDDLVNAWLDEPEPAAPRPAGGRADDLDSGGSSAADEALGAGGAPADMDVWNDAAPADASQGTDAESSGDTFGLGDADPLHAAGSSAEGISFEPAAAGDAVDAFTSAATGAAAGAVAVAATAKPSQRQATKAKKGGLGQIIGLVLGGAMAIPIVFGILVGLMWAGVNVPVGRSIGRALPESIAFIVPEKFRPGSKKPALGGGMGGAGKGSPLDALGTATPSGEDAASPEPGTGGDDLPSLAMDEPGGQESGEPLVDDTPVEPGDGETFEDPLAAVAEPAVKPVVPSPLDAEVAAAEAARVAAAAAAEAARADRKPLDTAVEQALVAVAALEEVADPEDPVRKKLLVDLYKSLAAVGAELAILERISADAGRPLVEAPESLDGLHDRLAAHRGDLVRLGRNWLDFAKRPSDGVLLPVTFQSSRKIGPYWSSKVTLPQAKEGVRELVVLSRAEPAAVAGDEVLVTGMVFDGGVIWAADVRQSARSGSGLF